MSYASFSRTPALSYFGVAPPGPVFRLDCKSGCDPVAFSPVSCQPNLDRIIREACSLALNAVRKLKESDSFTAGEFTRFFGHAIRWSNIRIDSIVARA